MELSYNYYGLSQQWPYQDRETVRLKRKLFWWPQHSGTPKPEKLIQRIIQLGSDEGDIILDFFMGSATTQSVAHKMNRQYIGIEQVNYIETVAVERLEKAIAGEQGGISEECWLARGGGSFVLS